MVTKMAPDLLTQITNEFRGGTLDRIASAVGESPAKTQSALGTLLPAVLSGLATKAATTEGANDVVDVIRRSNFDSVNLANVNSAEGVMNLANSGRSFTDSIFGGHVNSVIDWISSNSAVTKSSVTSLASICVPVVLGFIGRRLGTGINASSLTNLLGSPNAFLQNVPAGLKGALGLTGATTTVRHLADDTDRRVAAPVYATESTGSVWRWLLPLLLVAGLIGLFAYFFSNRPPTAPATVQTPPARTESATAPAAPAPAAPAPASLTAPSDLGAFIDSKLPNGINLHIPSNGVESKLLAFINDPSRAVDKDTWFSFDRIEFETDSAKLRPASREQLSNMAEILKAYPQVALKIGGYTDNIGDAAHNLKLSQDRANSTLNELVSLGIARSRLAAEGYGQEHPVADNSTPEGRQRNRRIDIRVTNK